MAITVFDIFTPGKTPTVTLVEDHLSKRRESFQDAIDQGGMLVTISGPSKSGKTVFVKSLVGGENLIAISGAGVETPEDLWARVFHIIGTPAARTSSSETNSGVAINGAAKIGGSAFIAKAEGSLSGGATLGTKESKTTTASIDNLQLLISEMGNTGFVLFIDDFHYMSREVQTEVARQIKEAIDKGVKIACASVPHRSEDVLKANADLRGRIVAINFDYWPKDSLRKIAEKGFREMKIKIDGDLIAKMVDEVAGSPQLMQSLCLNACLEAGFRVPNEVETSFPVDESFYSNVCIRAAVITDYSATFEKIKEGPKTRGTDRIQYRLKGGAVGDVYTIVLRAIALSPPTLHFRYAELVDRIKSVCEAETPVGSSVTGACHHIAELANDGQARDIVSWDGAEDVFDIRDPYLLFYIRWHNA